MEASIKLPRANVKDQNPHTQKRQIDVKRGNMSMDGSVGYFCWLLVSANFCIYQFSRKLQTTLSFGVFEFETKTWKHLFPMKFGRLTNLVVLKLNSKPIF